MVNPPRDFLGRVPGLGLLPRLRSGKQVEQHGLRVPARQQRRDFPDRQRLRAHLVHNKTQPFPGFALPRGGVHVLAAHPQADRLQQQLRAQALVAELRLHPLVHHPLMGRMRVHDDQALAVLGKDVDARQLGQRVSQGRHLPLGRSGPGLAHGRTGPAGTQGQGRGAQQRSQGGAARSAAGSLRRTVKTSRARPILHCLFPGRFAGPGSRQNRLQRAPDHVMNLPPFAKAHLQLGRMRVDVHQRGVHFQVQQPRRLTAVKHHVLISLAHGVGHRAVENPPPVQEQVLHVALAAGVFRARQPPAQVYALALFLEVKGVFDELRAQQLRNPLLLQLAAPRGRKVVAQAAVLLVTHAGGVAAQRRSQQRPVDMPRFRDRFAQETAPRRRVVEQVAYFNGGTLRVRRGARLGGAAAGAAHRPAAALSGQARREGEPRDGRDAGQRLAAKSQRRDGAQVFQAGDLAGGVARERHSQFRRGDTHAVITNPAQPRAALLHLHDDLSRARVQAVFQQFLDHRRRALHDLAGGDLVDQVVRQQLNRHRMAANTLRVFSGFPSR